MAHFTLQIDSAGGPMLSALVGLSGPHLQALQAAGQPLPPAVPVRALVDTGASHTVVDVAVIQQLGLQPIGVVSVITPTTGATPHQVNQYDVGLMIPVGQNLQPLMIPALPASSAALAHQGFQVLIGRDILRSCLLVYDGALGFFTLAF